MRKWKGIHFLRDYASILRTRRKMASLSSYFQAYPLLQTSLHSRGVFGICGLLKNRPCAGEKGMLLLIKGLYIVTNRNDFFKAFNTHLLMAISG